MKTCLLTSNQIEEVVIFLKKGEIVAFPTETVYGLAADATNEEAIRKIFIAKGRPTNHPLIVHIDSFEKIGEWVTQIPDSAAKIADHFWPGPITLLLQKKKNVSSLITGGLETIALRIPQHPIALQILAKLGKPVAAPSANAHKRTSPTKAEHVLKTLDGKIAAVINGDQCSIGLESTIINMTTIPPIIVRPGAINALMIREALGIDIQEHSNHQYKVPGNMSVHYQPKKPLVLLSTEEIKQRITQEKNIAIVHYTHLDKTYQATYYKVPENREEYAKRLYDLLYVIDNTDVDKIWVEKLPEEYEWLHITDRLNKAASK